MASSDLDNYISKLQDSLNTAYEKNRSVLKGQNSATKRQGAADTAISAMRGGYSGSPLEAGVNAENASRADANLGTNLEQLGADEAKQKLELDKEVEGLKYKEKKDADKANQDMLYNIFGGLGSVAGNLILPGLGGAVGGAAGKGLGDLFTPQTADDVLNLDNVGIY